MDYSKVYSNLIKKAKQRTLLEGYSEIHHILPRCLGGSDLPENLVTLTAKEHFIAHLLLVEIYPDQPKLAYALWMMATMQTENQERYKCSSRTYSRIKQNIAIKQEAHKKKISESLKRAYGLGLRKSNAGKKMPPEFGQKISAAKKGMVSTNKGKIMTPEQKKKRSDGVKEYHRKRKLNLLN